MRQRIQPGMEVPPQFLRHLPSRLLQKLAPVGRPQQSFVAVRTARVTGIRNVEDQVTGHAPLFRESPNDLIILEMLQDALMIDKVEFLAAPGESKHVAQTDFQISAANPIAVAFANADDQL